MSPPNESLRRWLRALPAHCIVEDIKDCAVFIQVPHGYVRVTAIIARSLLPAHTRIDVKEIEV